MSARQSGWPTAIDLFAGAGGLSLGLRSARYRVIGAVELDELAAETYRLNLPSVRMWQQDIRELNPADVLNELGLEPGLLGLLAGCPPCQGFSTIRTRQGRTVRDSRNSLVMDFVRFAEALRPRAVMMENVPGLARYGLFRTAVSQLRRLGYRVSWDIRDAADFDVAQRRKRLILVGALDGMPEFPDASKNVRTVRDAIGGIGAAGRSGDVLHDLPENRSSEVAARIQRIPPDGGSRSALGDDQLGCHQDFHGFTDVYGRMAWDRPSPTITGGCVNPSKGRFLHPVEHRSITLREALLLQGFPPEYKLSLRRGKFAAAAMVGNAIPPPLVAAHAKSIRELATTERTA